MIQLTVVSRVNDDKNFFFDVIFAVNQLQKIGIEGIKLLFVGEILSRAVFESCCRLTNLFGLTQNVSFTRKSIRITDLPENVKAGYFINFTIADFTGYSGVESVNLGYKTIFYNIDFKLAPITPETASVCQDIDALVKLIYKIVINPEVTNRLLIEDNLRIKNSFFLSDKDHSFLRSMLIP